jgi:hypothetical protein
VSLLAIDPGTTESGFVIYGGGRVLASGVMENESLLMHVRQPRSFSEVDRTDYVVSIAIEMIASYGMPVGREVFETCVWIGRFIEAWDGPHQLVYRKDVKLHLCNSPRAKDPHIRASLIDRFGGEGAIGRKAAPGPLYGVKSHAWAALAVAVTAQDNQGAPCRNP